MPPSPAASSPGSPRAFRREQVLVLLAITLLGAALRLWRLDDWSLWVDEAHSFRDATMPWDAFRSTNRARYPLAFLVLRWFLELFEVIPREGWLRLPFAFLGIVSVPLLAVMGRPMVGRRAALLAAGLLAVNPWHIYWSQSARAYVMVFLFGILAAGTFYRGWQLRSAWWIGVSLVALVLGGFAHPTCWLLLPALAVFVLMTRLGIPALGNARFWVGVVGCIGGVWLMLLVAEELPVFRSFMLAKGNASVMHLVQTSAFYFRIPLVLTAMAGLWILLREGRSEFLFLGAWTLVPGILLVLVGTMYVKATARYGFFVLPAVLLLAALAGVRMAAALNKHFPSTRWLGRMIPAALLPALLVVDMLAYDYLYFTVQYGDRPRWQEAARWVKGEAGERPVRVLTTNLPSMVYYFDPTAWQEGAGPAMLGALPIVDLNLWEVDAEGLIHEQLTAAERDGAWLVAIVTEPELEEKDYHGNLERLLRTRFQQRRSYPAWVGPKDQTVYVYAYGEP